MQGWQLSTVVGPELAHCAGSRPWWHPDEEHSGGIPRECGCPAQEHHRGLRGGGWCRGGMKHKRGQRSVANNSMQMGIFKR